MESEKYKMGYTGCYINDHPFRQLCRIPVEAAVEWVKKVCPDTYMGGCLARELTIGGDRSTDANMNGWTNKLFVLVANEHNKWTALVNHDGRFSVYLEEKTREEESDA